VRRRRFSGSCAGAGDWLMSSTSSSVANAFRTTLDLFETGINLMRQNLRRSHPAAADEEIERLLREWLLDRPGAECGDSAGRPVDLTTRFR
jgi:Rv0078B-related antitoxin